jgi:PKD repeat protein
MLPYSTNGNDFNIEIIIGIEADFTFQPNTPKINQKVIFTDNSQPDVAINWTWNFGDGNTSYLENPSHKYLIPGIYQISLTILTDGGINNTKIKNITISKEDKTTSTPTYSKPNAISNGPYFNITKQNISFDGSLSFDSDGEIISYIWNLDNGTIKYGKLVTHSYEIEGNYTVILTVEDNHGLTDIEYTYAKIIDDSDNDGWNDYIEKIYGTNPLDIEDYPLDTDNDGIPDESINDTMIGDTDDDNDGWDDYIEEIYGTNPLDINDYPLDTDNDGLPDKSLNDTIIGDTDDDNDGLSDEIEEVIGSNPQNKYDVKKINKNGKVFFLIDTDNDNNWNYIYDPAKNNFLAYIIDEQKEDFFIFYVLIGIISISIIIIIFKKDYFPIEFLFVEKYKKKLYYFTRKKR